MRGRRIASRGIVLVLVAAVLGLVPVAVARASCAGPSIAVGRLVEGAHAPADGPLPPAGAGVTVSGKWFSTGCDDTGTGSGCSGPPASTQAPMEVPLVLVQGDHSWLLGSADAGPAEEHYAITWAVTIPDDAQPGGARLEAGDATALAVSIAG